jgi:hypothetical protein
MAHVTVTARRTVIGLLTLVGGYYAVVGTSVLLNVGQVTRRWTLLSGDPDFPADSAQFGILIGIGAAIWVVLGVGTVVCGVRTLVGRPVRRASWVALAALAVVVHVPWLLYKSIGTGALPRPEAALQVRAAGLQFVAVALLYIVGLVATRHWPTRRAAG